MSIIGYDPNPWTQVDILLASVPVFAALVPAAVTLKLVRYTTAVMTFGTTHLTLEQRLALEARHPLLRTLTHITTALALIAGGLVVQVGLMS